MTLFLVIRHISDPLCSESGLASLSSLWSCCILRPLIHILMSTHSCSRALGLYTRPLSCPGNLITLHLSHRSAVL